MKDFSGPCICRASEKFWGENWDKDYPYSKIKDDWLWPTCFAYEYKKRWAS